MTWRNFKLFICTLIFIILSISIVRYEEKHQNRKTAKGKIQALPIKIETPNGTLVSAIKEMKVSARDEGDIFFWDGNGNLLERMYSSRNGTNDWEQEITVYAPQRKINIDGQELTVQDVQKAYFIRKDRLRDGQRVYDPGERVIVLDGRNIIAEYFRKKTNESREESLWYVIVYEKGRPSGMYYFGAKPMFLKFKKLDKNFFVRASPPGTKLTEILKMND